MGEGVTAVELLKFSADSDFGADGVKVEGLFEPILRHCKVDDGGPLLLVEEVVIRDGEKDDFVDGLEGCPGVEVHPAAHQFLEGLVAGRKGGVRWLDEFRAEHACRGIVVATVNGRVHVFVALGGRVEV